MVLEIVELGLGHPCRGSVNLLYSRRTRPKLTSRPTSMPVAFGKYSMFGMDKMQDWQFLRNPIVFILSFYPALSFYPVSSLLNRLLSPPVQRYTGGSG